MQKIISFILITSMLCLTACGFYHRNNRETWSLVDPTLADNSDDNSVKEFVGDGSNYTAKYVY